MARKTELIQVSETIRVESGPRREKAIATRDMEPERDAKGKATVDGQERRAVLPSGKVLAKHYKLGLRDSRGKAIKEGEEFEFLDYFGAQTWYMYQLEDVPFEDGFLTRMAQVLSARAGEPVAAEDVTVEMLAEWFQVDPGWIGLDAEGKPHSVKRYMPRGEKPSKDEALIAAGELKGKE